MSRRRLLPAPLASLAAVATLSVVGACAGARASGPGAGAVPPGVARAAVDTLGVRLVALEVRRLAAEADGLTAANPARRELDHRIDALRGQLRELDAPGASSTVDRRLLAVLDARQAGLLVQRRDLLATLTPENPRVRQVEAEISAVERRRGELRGAAGPREATDTRR